MAARKKRGDTSDPPKKPRAEKRRYARADVKDGLRAMFGSRCAYCEGEVEATSHLHVEHFRPQSRYPALAYEWDNLLLACGKCNGDHKGDHFPVRPHGRSLAEDARSPCSRGAGDVPILLDPCRDDPAAHLKFRNGRVIPLTLRGRRTRDLCGLNREPLVEDRRKWLEAVRVAIVAYKRARVIRAEADARKYGRFLARCVDGAFPYTAMSRGEIAANGIDAAQLPR